MIQLYEMEVGQVRYVKLINCEFSVLSEESLGFMCDPKAVGIGRVLPDSYRILPREPTLFPFALASGLMDRFVHLASTTPR